MNYCHVSFFVYRCPSVCFFLYILLRLTVCLEKNYFGNSFEYMMINNGNNNYYYSCIYAEKECNG